MLDFFHNFSPNPVFIEFGIINIRYYGLFIVLAIILAIIIAGRLAKDKLSLDDIIDLAFWLAIAGIIGARLYEVLILEPGYFFSHPSEIIKIWHGGLAIHGAIIGGLVALVFWCHQKKQSFWLIADLIAVVLPIAQAIGRLGNYFNQEVFGLPTDLPWGIYIAPNNRPSQFLNHNYFHPTFLYEAVLNLLLFLILFFTYRQKKLARGQYFSVYLIGYGAIRFLMEFIRSDQTAMFFGLRWPQVFSLILIVTGIIIFYKRKK